MASLTSHDLSYESGEKILHYLSGGPDDGELIVFMHGWPGIAKTWHHQMTACIEKGYRVVAPDMPGYGGSTHRKVTSDYAQEKIVNAMLALLSHIGRSQAIWVAHDWGCGALWCLARGHPEVCKAVCGMTVPFGILEFGYANALQYVDREIYPETEHPFGQWSYMVFYEQDFEKATAWFEKDTRGFLKAALMRSGPHVLGKPGATAGVLENGGWMGGIPSPPSPDKIPDEAVCLDKETFEELVAAMEKTGWWAADSYYMNHQANIEYSNASGGPDVRLKFPVLFIEAQYDRTLDTAHTRLAERQKELCDDLTYVSIESGHFVPVEKPKEVNQALLEWLANKVK